MTPLEMWLDGIANISVCLLCIITTSILISSWYSISGEDYPRWTLVAIALLYLDFAMKRILAVIALGYSIYSFIVIWDIISILFTTIGMIGHIRKVKWVRDRLQTYKADVAKERAVIEDMKIEETKKDTEIKMLQTKLILLSDSKA